MTMHEQGLHEPIIEADLHAYLDGQIPVRRRIAVEAYLAQQPELAARMMADLRLNRELRMALSEQRPGIQPNTSRAARNLERALVWRGHAASLRRYAALAAFLMLGWFAHAQYGALGIGEVVASGLPPSYVEDAMATYAGAKPAEKAAEEHYSPENIRASTAIVMPTLPEGWTVDDVAVASSRFGPSVKLTLSNSEVGPAVLMAVRPGAFDVQPPSLSREDGMVAAYWQIGEVAYALVARAETQTMEKVAGQMARTLY